MRNAIAHFNIEFLPDQDNEIAGIKVWNRNKSVKTWEVELTLKQLEDIARRFIDLIKAKTK